MSLDKKITIKDIAKRAEISAGTVDRVLHDRGEVSEKSKEKIKAVLKELNYEPNLIASSLSARKTYKIITLIPSFHEGDYWEAVDKGIDRAGAEVAKFNVEVEKRYFNQFEAQSFYNEVDALNELDFQGLLISPILRDKSLALCTNLKKRGIPVVFIDSQIESADFLAYFGQPSFQSGFVGAKFVTASLIHGKNIVLFRTLRKGFIGANQTLQRQEGFLAYLNEYRPDCSVINVELQTENAEMNELLMSKAFDERNNVGAAVIFNSTVHTIASFLEREKLTGITLLGYDALKKNIEFLKKGIIAIVIAQRPEMQTYNGIKALFNDIVLKKDVRRINYMPIDLLVKENADYYTEYKAYYG